MSDHGSSIREELTTECPDCIITVDCMCYAEKRRKRSDTIQFNVVVTVEVRRPVTASETEENLFSLSTENLQTVLNSLSGMDILLNSYNTGIYSGDS